MNEYRMPYPIRRQVPGFKPVRNLTCPHGRFWLSCLRCRLQGETAQRTVGIGGDSRQQPDAAFWPSSMGRNP